MVNKVDLAFYRLLTAYNKPKRSPWRRLKNGKLKARVGTWVLDRAYGGYKVSQIVTVTGGERDLFDQKRRKPAEFIRWVDAVIAAKKQR